jgi:hypothetical protein
MRYPFYKLVLLVLFTALIINCFSLGDYLTQKKINPVSEDRIYSEYNYDRLVLIHVKLIDKTCSFNNYIVSLLVYNSLDNTLIIDSEWVEGNEANTFEGLVIAQAKADTLPLEQLHLGDAVSGFGKITIYSLDIDIHKNFELRTQNINYLGLLTLIITNSEEKNLFNCTYILEQDESIFKNDMDIFNMKFPGLYNEYKNSIFISTNNYSEEISASKAISN